jgi:hypothetical protein
MRIKLVYGSPSQGQRDYEADAVPRIGETVRISAEDEDARYEVRVVEWYPDEPDFDVYVFAR